VNNDIFDLILKFITIGSVLTGGIAIYIAVRNNSRQVGAPFLRIPRFFQGRLVVPLSGANGTPNSTYHRPANDRFFYPKRTFINRRL